MPFVLLVPLVSFLLAVSSIRTRRSASAMAMFGTVVTAALTLLVAWGLTRKPTFSVTYHYFDMSVAFSGPLNFQSFGISLAMQADHLTVAALIAVELCVLAALGWHRFLGRSEPGAARFHAVVTLLLFGAAGVLLSTDLAELFGFWAIAGAMTYLLLEHRWGIDVAATRARVALALPFLTDLTLLCGIAWFYSRYGTQSISTLISILHTNPGWTVRSIVLGCVLLFIGLTGRLALWPLSAWITQTSTTAPPAAVALVQAVWSVLAIVVLFRLMPLFGGSSQQLLQVLAVVCAASAIAAPLWGLLGNEPRRTISLVGAGASAICAAVVIDVYRGNPAAAIAGVAAMLAIAPARAGAMLALSSIAAAMRTDDLADMGDALGRMRASSVALLFSIVVIALAGCTALAYGVSSRSRVGLVLGEGVLLIAICGLRVFLGASLGPLRRRRAFEPDRVREAPSESIGYPYWLALGGAAFLVGSLITGWLTFLDGKQHPAAGFGALAIWAAVVIAGFLATTYVFVRGKDGALAASAAAGVLLGRATGFAYAVFERFFVAPMVDIADRLDGWIPEGDSALGRFTTTAGQLALAAARVPAVALVVVFAVVLAVLFALIGPGVIR
ncbi:MAG TPA: proton-conducting transporter membrane subunit [Candidatus Dormibacteraeota bacterium]|nr:proton-conducting transporter membrane subunit [Candidatus Dormibacteraeota bacterium]